MLTFNTPNLPNTYGLFSSWKNTNEPFGFPNFALVGCSETRESRTIAEEMVRIFPTNPRKSTRSERNQKRIPRAKSEAPTGCRRHGKLRKDSFQQKALQPTLFFILNVRETNTSFCGYFLRQNCQRQDGTFRTSIGPVRMHLRDPFVEIAVVCSRTRGGFELPLQGEEWALLPDSGCLGKRGTVRSREPALLPRKTEEAATVRWFSSGSFSH